jgi:hypothetical protein
LFPWDCRHVKVEKGDRTEMGRVAPRLVPECISFGIVMPPPDIHGYETKRHVSKFMNFDGKCRERDEDRITPI